MKVKNMIVLCQRDLDDIEWELRAGRPIREGTVRCLMSEIEAAHNRIETLERDQIRRRDRSAEVERELNEHH